MSCSISFHNLSNFRREILNFDISGKTSCASPVPMASEASGPWALASLDWGFVWPAWGSVESPLLVWPVG